MNSVLPFTYTLSAQVYVNDFAALGTIPPAPRLHPITPPQPSPTGGGSRLVATGTSAALIKNTGSAPAHRHYPNPPTAARTPTVLPPPPWGRDGVMAASTPQSDKYKIAHHPYSPTATALPPSPCGGGAGGGVCPHTSLANRQPAKPFTYTLSAQVYVKHPGTECVPTHHLPPNLSTTARIPTVLPPPLQDAPASAAGKGWGGGSVLASATDAKLSSCNPATITRIPTALPPPVGEGRGGGSQHPAKRQIQNRPSSILINCHRSAPSLAGRASVRSGRVPTQNAFAFCVGPGGGLGRG